MAYYLISLVVTKNNTNKSNRFLDISHWVVKPDTDATNQLMTQVNNLWPFPLVIAIIPLLHIVGHLDIIVQYQGKVFEVTMSSDGSWDDEILEGKLLKLPLRTPRILNLVINNLQDRIRQVGIIANSTSVPLVVQGLELLESPYSSVVRIGSVGDKARRWKSVGSRHFVWRTGW